MGTFKRRKLASLFAAMALCGIGAVSAQDGPGSAAPSAQDQAQAPAPASPADVFPESTSRHFWFRHLKSLPSDIKTAGLNIEVVDAPTMSARLTNLFRQAGYNMVPVDQAVHRYQLRGSFQSDGKVKAQVPLGKPLENAAKGVRSGASAAKRAGDVLAAGVLADQVLKSGLTTPIWAAGDLLQAVLEASGMRDSINTALTGDRRGWCLVGCTYWDWSDQGVVLSWQDPRTTGQSSASAVEVGVYAKGVFVDELAALALNEFMRHHGVVQTPEPQTEALMSISQRMSVARGRAQATIKLVEQ